MQSLSRRGFLGATAGAAIASALPLSRALSLGQPAAAAPLAGANVDASSYGITNELQAAKIADGYIGLPLATTIQKIYFKEGVFGKQPPAKMTQLAAGGCQFIVDLRPSRVRSLREQSILAAWLAMMNKSGINYRVMLWSEFNDMAFTNVHDYQAYWNYYAPVVKSAGVVCGYNPGCNPNWLPLGIAAFPTSPAPDELWMDYYATAFRAGARLETLLGVAEAAGVPAGFAEWGWFAGVFGPFPMTMPLWNDFCNYVLYLAQQHKFGLGAIYFGGVHGTEIDVIYSSSDPRIPMIQAVSNAIMAG